MRPKNLIQLDRGKFLKFENITEDFDCVVVGTDGSSHRCIAQVRLV